MKTATQRYIVQMYFFIVVFFFFSTVNQEICAENENLNKWAIVN